MVILPCPAPRHLVQFQTAFMGAGSRLAGKYPESLTIISLNPAQVVRRGVKRES